MEEIASIMKTARKRIKWIRYKPLRKQTVLETEDVPNPGKQKEDKED